MTTLTIYALFGDDIRLASTDKGASSNATQSTQIARAGRASRAGTRAGRVIRIIRLIRLIRIVKLYKLSQQAIKDQIAQEENSQNPIFLPQNGRRKQSIQIADTMIEHQRILLAKRRSTKKMTTIKRKASENDQVNHQYSQVFIGPTSEENLIDIQKENLSACQKLKVGTENLLQEFRQKEDFLNEELVEKRQQMIKNPSNSIQNLQANQMIAQQIFNEDAQAEHNQENIINQRQSSQNIVDTKTVQLQSSFQQQSDETEDFQIPNESKVGKKLSELTTKRVIILVLAMMFGLSLFESGTYIQENSSYKYGLKVLDYFIQEQNIAGIIKSFNTYISLHQDIRNPLIFFELENVYAGIQNPFEGEVKYQDLRSNEIEYVVLTNNKDYNFNSIAVFDLRADTQLQAILSIVRTCFICVILAAGSILFSKDTNDIILGPIENMIQKVTKISLNPLKAAQEEEEEEYNKQLIFQQKQNKSNIKKKEQPMETEFLEKTIVQIGALLALGFGEAGSQVIAQNISSGNGEVNPMISGKKTQAIFGFCDIRNFTDATEVLQEGVMVFVNEIAEIVHSQVDLFSGSANKNIGDAFLLV